MARNGEPKVSLTEAVYDDCVACPSDADIRRFPKPPMLRYLKGKPYCPIHYPLAVEKDRTDKKYSRDHDSFMKTLRRLFNA